MPNSNFRSAREAEFHDRAFTEDVRARTAKFYAVTEISKRFYVDLITRKCSGARVLEYGCGPGGYAADLARAGATVTAIDVSESAIELGRQEAVAAGFAEQTSFHVMNAESMAFPEHHFDLICGCGILHHLDVPRALAEVIRVLGPGGRAIFYEPQGHNALIKLYRRLTPSMRTEDEHPLLWSDLEAIRLQFDAAQFHFFHLLSLVSFPFRSMPGYGFLLRMLGQTDRFLFRLPRLKRQAWVVVMDLGRK